MRCDVCNERIAERENGRYTHIEVSHERDISNPEINHAPVPIPSTN